MKYQHPTRLSRMWTFLMILGLLDQNLAVPLPEEQTEPWHLLLSQLANTQPTPIPGFARRTGSSSSSSSSSSLASSESSQSSEAFPMEQEHNKENQENVESLENTAVENLSLEISELLSLPSNSTSLSEPLSLGWRIQPDDDSVETKGEGGATDEDFGLEDRLTEDGVEGEDWMDLPDYHDNTVELTL